MPKLKKYSQIITHEEPNHSQSEHIAQKNNQISKSTHDLNPSSDESRKGKESDSESHSSSKSRSDSEESKGFHSKKTKANSIKNKNDQSKNEKKTERKKKSEKQKNADEALKRLQEECANNEDSDEDTKAEIPEELISDNKKKKKQRKIKSNKFFELSIENEKENYHEGIKELGEEEEKELEQIKKENEAKIIARQEKNEKKKFEMKLKMENKIQQKNNPVITSNVTVMKSLMSQVINIKEEEEINIDIEVDQIVKGKNARQANGTLFLKKMAKNQSQSQTEESMIKPPVENDKKENKYGDRKEFYRDFEKELKESKAINFTTETDNLFKISSLDDLELDKNSTFFREDSRSKNSVSNFQDKNQTNRSRQSETNNSNGSFNNNSNKNKNESEDRSQNLLRHETKRVSGKEISTVVENLFEEDSRKNNFASELNMKEVKDLPGESRLSNEHLKEISIQQPKSESEKNKSKLNKGKKEKENVNQNKKSKKNKFYSDFFEDEAEDSDEQEGDGDNGESSNSDDDDSIESLIDRNEVIHVQKNEKLARKKLREEMERKDDEEYERIKEKILKPRKIKMEENSESRERRKRRIKDKQEKFANEDSCDAEFKNTNNDKGTTEDQESKEELKEYLNTLESEITAKDKHQEPTKLETKTHQILPSVFSLALRNSFKNLDKNKNIRGGFINTNKGIAGAKAQFQPKKSRTKSKEIKY